jgi:hypothetical protein
MAAAVAEMVHDDIREMARIDNEIHDAEAAAPFDRVL